MNNPPKWWAQPIGYTVFTICLVLVAIFWQLNTGSPNEGTEMYQLLLRVIMFFPIVIPTLHIVYEVYKEILAIKKQQFLNDSYFKDLQLFLGDKETYTDKDILLKGIIQILKTIDEKKNNDIIKEKRKYFDVFLFLLTYTTKEINLSLKGNRNGKYSIRLNNPKDFIEIWEKGLDSTSTSFFALNYPTDKDSFGRKDDPSSLDLQKRVVNEVKKNRGQFIRVFVIEEHDKEELKRLYHIMNNQKKDAGIDVKIIEEKEFNSTYFDEIKTIGNENFCIINNSFLIIFKLNQFGVREECEITFDTEKIQAAKNIMTGLTDPSGKQKNFDYPDSTSFIEDNYMKESDERFVHIEEKYESVRTMIALAELENALTKLQEIVRGNKDAEDRVIMQLTRFNENKKKVQSNLIDLENASITTQQISHATLDLIKEFKNAEYRNVENNNANNALNANRRETVQ